MVSLGLTQKALAMLAGVNETYVRDLYKGKSRNPTTGKLAAIARALGCRLEDLTDPRRPGLGEQAGQDSEHLSELAVVGLWRRLSPRSKREAIVKLLELIPEVPPERAITPCSRKADDV